MKTRKEVARLKLDWYEDPCWDLEDTPEFEEYHDELLEYSNEWKKKWEQNYQEKLLAKAESLGVPGNTKLAQYVFILEQKLKEFRQEIDELNNNR